MRIYIIGNDGITLSHEAPATVSEGEIAIPPHNIIAETVAITIEVA